MKIGTPILKVKNISKVLDFYQKYLGLQVNNKKDDDNSSVYELGLKICPHPILTFHHF
jgi:catechol 2,3-dioxygenase-like lactoylglutathione lyase family enzyme